MIIVIVAIFGVIFLAGYIAEGFGHDSDIPNPPDTPSPPEGGIVESILAPFKWAYDNSLGALIDIIDGVPNGMPSIVIVIVTAIISILIVLYLVELIRGKG